MSRLLQQGCFGKTRYDTKADAKRANGRMRAYRCPTCDGYHVRSKVSKRQSR